MVHRRNLPRHHINGPVQASAALLLVTPDEAATFAAEPLVADGGLHHLPVAVPERHPPQQPMELGDALPSLLPVPQPSGGAEPHVLHHASLLIGAGGVGVVPRVAPVPDAAGVHEHGPRAGLLGGDEVHEDVLAVALPVDDGARGREPRRAGVAVEEAGSEDHELGEHHGVPPRLRRRVRPPPAGEVQVVRPREEPDQGGRVSPLLLLLPGGEREGERGGVGEHVVVRDGDGGGADVGGAREEARVEGGGGGAAERDAAREPAAAAQQEAGRGGGVAPEHEHGVHQRMRSVGPRDGAQQRQAALRVAAEQHREAVGAQRGLRAARAVRGAAGRVLRRAAVGMGYGRARQRHEQVEEEEEEAVARARLH
ncbi:hypothetical protein U9M48_038266 [Paspalum notatum var. saurae]|uniref:Uncharacterized protein n=1 Tax=Paspalum notatum var. saurae TaxID=547442 RepID=A0AAQ3UL00_PASNO